MDTNNVYKLAVQAQLAAALRELMRLEYEESQMATLIHVEVSCQGDIDVQVLTDGLSLEGYSL
jgi:hypothetical protein